MNMTVSIEQIKKLRDMTGVSMTVCKKALEESNGDFDEAVTVLRKKGEAKAAARSERTTANGSIAVSVDGSKAAMSMVLCETDFVSRGDEFVEMVSSVNAKLLSGEITDKDTDIELLKDAGLKLGENLQIGGLKFMEAPVIGAYLHSNSQIGVLVALEGGSETLAKDIAMHAAAMNPAVISPDEISEELVAKEKEIWAEHLASEGKPANILENIMMGKEKKFREESALIKQKFVKDPEKTIEQLLSDAGATIKEFVRFSV